MQMRRTCVRSEVSLEVRRLGVGLGAAGVRAGVDDDTPLAPGATPARPSGGGGGRRRAARRRHGRNGGRRRTDALEVRRRRRCQRPIGGRHQSPLRGGWVGDAVRRRRRRHLRLVRSVRRRLIGVVDVVGVSVAI